MRLIAKTTSMKFTFTYPRCPKGMIILSAVIICCLMIGSCKKGTNSSCGADPLNKIAWLQNYIRQSDSAGTKIRVYEVSYKTQSGFLIEDSVPPLSADEVTGNFITCDGQVICTFGGLSGGNCLDFQSQSSRPSLIYSTY